ncbi:hypothetical protein AUK40_03505 [Candidatus Wirthbacteria bacterium CG2_30_54_11]|uniref:DUF3048 domain-containing protein n=1 Tax=Candidatus Wirthbacteria bacterium CG2_30_54_11 TaxID=1817892 RepID=A0A1J5IKT9_9BACT|nr:MAG: hypothetical protein AUK40_03505 [Candidatus Wirthbacteria bacterium CG2_30_54_11]
MGLESLAAQKVDFTGEDQKRKKKMLVFAGIAAFILLCAGGILAWSLLAPKHPAEDVSATTEENAAAEPAEDVPEEPKVVLATSYLTGEQIPPETATLRPIAVSIENHQASRPPTGLALADIVYEMPVEAGITRFLALYQKNEPEKVGPERSARVYMLEWVKEYDAIFAHIGQDPKVLTLTGPYGIDDLRDTGAWWDPYSAARPAQEHRAYTSILRLREVADEKGWGFKDSFDSWSFLDAESDPAGRPASQIISIDYSSEAYLSEWSYDPGLNAYLRWDGGVMHEDVATEAQISARNVIIEYVSVWFRAGDEKGRRDMKIVGEGDLVVFRDGQAVTGTWRKDSREARTQLLDTEGNVISLVPGNIWVEIVPALENMVTYDTQASVVDPAVAPQVEEPGPK